PRLHRRAGEDDALDAAGFQRLRRQGARAVALAGAGGADAEGEAVALDGVDVLLLGGGLGGEGAVGAGGRVGGIGVVRSGVEGVDVGGVVVLAGFVSSGVAGFAVEVLGMLQGSSGKRFLRHAHGSSLVDVISRCVSVTFRTRCRNYCASSLVYLTLRPTLRGLCDSLV